MLEEMRAAPEAIQPSGYCRYLNGLNLSQLEKSVFAQFKRTINGQPLPVAAHRAARLAIPSCPRMVVVASDG